MLGEPGGDRCEPGIHDLGVVVVDFVERRVFNRADLGGGLVEKAAAAASRSVRERDVERAVWRYLSALLIGWG